MSDIDNTNDLDSYGVWVKQPGKENNVEEFDSADIFDLPDFPDTPLDEDTNLDDFLNDTDTKEETEDSSIEVPSFEDEAVEETGVDLGDFDLAEPSPEPAFEETVEETAVEEASTEINLDDFGSEEEISLDDFGFDENAEETPAEEAPAETPVEEAAEDDFQLPEEDGEISLDAFMDGDFSDESVAAGNNGFSEDELAAQKASSTTEEVSFEDGELSLDDFLDGGEFTMAPEEVEPKKEEIADEKPLEMDISFDAEADTVETEENVELDLDNLQNSDSESGDEESRSTEVSGDTEEIDLSDFGIDADADETPINQDVDESKLKDKVVDYELSVGDEKMDAAPVVNEIKEADNSESAPAPQAVVPEGSEVVPSDLLKQIIADLSGLRNEINTLKNNLEEMKPSPAVSEPAAEESFDTVFDETTVEETPVVEENVAIEEPVVEETPVIQDEIVIDEPAVEETVIEDEIVIDEPVIEETMVDEPVIEETPVVEDEPVFEEASIEETVVEDQVESEPALEEEVSIEDDLNFEIETPADENTGFFGDDDSDDTIALSGNELDNIMSSVEITETVADDAFDTVTEEPAEESVEEDLPEIEDTPDIDEEISISDDISDAFVSKLEGEEIEFETEAEEDPVIIDTPADEGNGFFGDDDGDDTIALSGNELDNILNTAEFTEEINDDGIDFSPAEEENFEINDSLEEPDLDNISIPEDDEEELPDEISIPKTDDILVESSSSDFMDSVKDSSEDVVDDYDDFMASETEVPAEITDATIDYLSEEEPVEEVSEDTSDPFGNVDSIFEEPAAEEPAAEEPVVEETPVEEPVIEETIAEEPAVDESFDTEIVPETEPEVIVEENEEPAAVPPVAPTAPETPAATENSSLQNDIKSVLLYMDQLLENLPEEKIVEFAKSEEFATYKKLFTELGLA